MDLFSTLKGYFLGFLSRLVTDSCYYRGKPRVQVEESRDDSKGTTAPSFESISS